MIIIENFNTAIMGINSALEGLGTMLSWEQRGNYPNKIYLDKPTHGHLKPTSSCIEMAGWMYPYSSTVELHNFCICSY